MSGLLDSIDVKLIVIVESVLKIIATLFPIVFCQLPLTKFAKVNEQILLLRMRKYLTQIIRMVVCLAEIDNTVKLLSVLIKQPTEFWGCLEIFEKE